ncbi:scavenger receptor cysteine-rich type 1 protein M160-like [Boleophthalmus pectinirostris]|uniref:scavenger receptor cysteine-rich type 1 protein M160-like n=1 Tax=Boleophthalmus pectinirostris TaxID=150288 RepID=UPI0024329E0E|nr:scavenger receptor cysteine-rich type 1 protein M160-like [Boleophthalmus pectinirostris]
MAFRVLVLTICCLGALAENSSAEPCSLRLVGGPSRCEGELELQRTGLNWTRVSSRHLTVEFGARVCSELDCGPALSVVEKISSKREVVNVSPNCDETSLIDCFRTETFLSDNSLQLKCSESVRLVSGSGVCSGSVQIWNQSWTWLCEGTLDQVGAEVLCRELGCEAPSRFQGALSPLRQPFHCEGHESSLMACPHSGSENCSSGAAVNLTCSGPVRLVGGASRCAGTLQVRHRGEWRRVIDPCLRSVFSQPTPWVLSVMSCDVSTDSVRLVSGSGLCSGSVQIWDQSWTWLCEGALDQLGAEVLCRELDCGAPFLFQGVLSPLGQTFHCEGHESALMDCPHSSSETCSSGAAVNITCSEPLRLVGGANRCAGTLEVRHRGEWRRMVPYHPRDPWNREATAVVCRDLDCGSAISEDLRDGFPQTLVWDITSVCARKRRKKFAVRECIWNRSYPTDEGFEVVCSESVRLVSGSSLCSGSVQIWNQSWTGLCEGALDQLGAEVLCRELDCGAPSLFKGALSPLRQTFHCEGNESALMDCPHSSSETCSSGATVNLTCSEPLRLVGEASRCAGIVEVRHRGEWRRMTYAYENWNVQAATAVCRDLDCDSAVSGYGTYGLPETVAWVTTPDCVKRKQSAVRDCVGHGFSPSAWGLVAVCSDLLKRPVVSLTVSDGASEAQPQGLRVLLGSKFMVKCSVEPQYLGGSFQLLSPTMNYTLPAVNHSAHFLFSDTGPTHKGNYTCIYHVQVFNHNFSSQSPSLQLYLGASDSDLMIRVLLILLLKLLYILPMYYYYCKTRARMGARERI